MKKTIIPLICTLLVLGFFSCKKEKCSYYNDINNYYDLSVETWTRQNQQGIISDTILETQLYKIEQERADLRKLYKDCVN